MFDLCLAVLIWGLSFALAKMALQSLSPLELVTIRLFLGGVAGLVILRFVKKSSFKFSKKSFLLSTFEFAGTYIFYTMSLMYLPSGVVASLTLLTPFLTYLVSFFRKQSRFSKQALGATLLSFVGAFLCLPKGAQDQIFSGQITGVDGSMASALIGVCLILVSNLFFAIGNTFIEQWKLAGVWTEGTTVAGLFGGAFLSAIVYLFYLPSDWNHFLKPDIWIVPLYLGIVATGLGFFLWNRGVSKVMATKGTLVGNFKAPLAVIWGFVLLGETISWKLFAGLLLLIVSTKLLPHDLSYNRKMTDNLI